MLDKITIFLTDFMSSLQVAKIYSTDHPNFKDFVDKTFASLGAIFEERDELVLGIVEGELAVGQEIFFDLSQKLRSLIIYLQDKGVERIVFLRALQKEELVKFISFLITRWEEEEEAQEALSRLGIENITSGKITTVSPAGEIEEEPEGEKAKKILNYARMYEDSVDTVSQSLQTVIDEEDLDYMGLRFNMSNFMENLMGRYQELFNLASVKSKDKLTFYHLLNVTILSMYFSSKLGYAKDDVLDVGVAALFHDVGKLYISQKILKKKAKLEDEEFRRVKEHAVLGSELLFRHLGSLGILPVVVAFEHHLRYDLKGYPKVSFPKKPHPVSLIVSICDVYDALAQVRSYKRDYPPLKIYNIMIKERGGLFDPELLDKFFKVIGVWPVGTIVSLSDGRIAVVRDTNEDDIFRPKVELLEPEQKKEFIDLSEQKEFEIKASLNAFAEGKEYIKYI